MNQTEFNLHSLFTGYDHSYIQTTTGRANFHPILAKASFCLVKVQLAFAALPLALVANINGFFVCFHTVKIIDN